MNIITIKNCISITVCKKGYFNWKMNYKAGLLLLQDIHFELHSHFKQEAVSHENVYLLPGEKRNHVSW
jgi:hypothetical protein